MTKLREEARGRDCTVRLPGCNGGGESTVLAHYRLAGTCGMGIKPPDRQRLRELYSRWGFRTLLAALEESLLHERQVALI